MSLFKVMFDDPNPEGSVDYYRIEFMDRDGKLFIKKSMTASAGTTSKTRVFSYSNEMTAAEIDLPISVTITAVRNGVPSLPATYLHNVPRPYSVNISGITIS